VTCDKTTERRMNRRKQFRGVATRFDKLADRYQATITVADIFIWLRARPDRSRDDPRNTLLGSGYNHPCRLAQRNRMVEMAIMAASTTARWGKSVRSFTMMFIPYTDDSAVIGRVSTAMRARRSAAMVTLVSVRAL